jgi:hypothetical protein
MASSLRILSLRSASSMRAVPRLEPSSLLLLWLCCQLLTWQVR